MTADDMYRWPPGSRTHPLPTADDAGAVLDAIRARADAATDGPWDAADEHGLIPGATPAWCVSRMGPPTEARPDGWMHDVAWMPQDEPQGQRDADFIAHARQDVPRLLAAVDAVLGLCAEWEAGGDDWTPVVVRAAITEALTRKEEA